MSETKPEIATLYSAFAAKIAAALTMLEMEHSSGVECRGGDWRASGGMAGRFAAGAW